MKGDKDKQDTLNQELVIALYYKQGNERVVQLLKDGADINHRVKSNDEYDIGEQYGRTLLHNYCIESDESAIKFLIENGADANIKDFSEERPLDKVQNVKIQKLLLRSGAIPESIHSLTEAQELIQKEDAAKANFDLIIKAQELMKIENAIKADLDQIIEGSEYLYLDRLPEEVLELIGKMITDGHGN